MILEYEKTPIDENKHLGEAFQQLSSCFTVGTPHKGLLQLSKKGLKGSFSENYGLIGTKMVCQVGFQAYSVA